MATNGTTALDYCRRRHATPSSLSFIQDESFQTLYNNTRPSAEQYENPHSTSRPAEPAHHTQDTSVLPRGNTCGYTQFDPSDRSSQPPYEYVTLEQLSLNKQKPMSFLYPVTPCIQECTPPPEGAAFNETTPHLTEIPQGYSATASGPARSGFDPWDGPANTLNTETRRSEAPMPPCLPPSNSTATSPKISPQWVLQLQSRPQSTIPVPTPPSSTEAISTTTPPSRTPTPFLGTQQSPSSTGPSPIPTPDTPALASPLAPGNPPSTPTTSNSTTPTFRCADCLQHFSRRYQLK
ncbi:MAG: hypothetical protein M1839_002559 [Geoglossum umbratile]|nr:MAG: hypothetical protein M1839_002559 [Geoglossum umbratile]